ncbi:MAG: hypothetical protein FWH35_00155 [Treponema sp.]|nr:hypothetical protein [Treponema sp.]
MHLQGWGFFRVDPEYSGVPVVILCDDSELSKYYRWEHRIAFRIPPGPEPPHKDLEHLYGEAGFVTVSNDPVVMDWGDTPEDIVNKLKDFVIKNKKILELISDGRITHEEFFDKMVRV